MSHPVRSIAVAALVLAATAILAACGSSENYGAGSDWENAQSGASITLKSGLTVTAPEGEQLTCERHDPPGNAEEMFVAKPVSASIFSLAPGDYGLTVYKRLHRNWSRLTKVGWSRLAGSPEGPVEIIWTKKAEMSIVWVFTTLPGHLIGEVITGTDESDVAATAQEAWDQAAAVWAALRIEGAELPPLEE